MEVKTRKKLIEVALPLDAINAACAREKSIRHGHPSTLHLWWARRPLAAARSVIFSQMVDDPSTYVDELLKDSKLKAKAEGVLRTRLKRWEDAVALAKKAEAAKIKAPPPGEKPTLEEVIAEIERERIFRLIEQLVEWENTTNEEVLGKVREEIWKSWRRTCADNANHPKAKELFDPKKLPAFHDPFAGGGALPLEAQRLGLEAYASDLNPVAVVLNKAMIEIPPRFSGKPPINPDATKNRELITKAWEKTKGLAEDIEYYGKKLKEIVAKKVGSNYPTVKITKENAQGRHDLGKYINDELGVIAWLWCRSVKCPNPACKCDMPLLSSLTLSSKNGKEWYITPQIKEKKITFVVTSGKPKIDPQKGYKRGVSGIFECAICGTTTTRDYVAEQATSGGLKKIQTAVICEGKKGRVYLNPNASLSIGNLAKADITGLDIDLGANPRDVWCRNFGLLKPKDLFTDRQLVALTTFSDEILQVLEIIKKDIIQSKCFYKDKTDKQINTPDLAYANAIAVYLACAGGKLADYNSSLCSWISGGETMRNTFGRQAIPMVWDFAEANPLSDSTGSYLSCLDQVKKVVCELPAINRGFSTQENASEQNLSRDKIVSTDPPYYDNIGYADLSDFFYVWLRRSLKNIYPELFTTVAVPKSEELVATPYRHGSKEKAEQFFLAGMTHAMTRLSEQCHPAFPVTIYYAFKQTENNSEDGLTNTGWDTFLEAIIKAGFSVSGTWPMRTERNARSTSIGTNALASSIVLVCRQKSKSLPSATRRDFLVCLHKEMPSALRNLQKGNIAPVDLAQASIGPGMAIFTKFSKIIDADGRSLSVRMALGLINQVLDEVLQEQEGEFDSETRWALAWFEQHGFSEGSFGDAEGLSKAKVTAVNGLVDAGIIKSKTGKVTLLKKGELEEDWSPETDKRLTVWEITHHLIRALDKGEVKASDLLARIGPIAEAARDLAYRLYSICEKKNWSKEGQDYNGLVQAWPNIQAGAKEAKTTKLKQGELI